LRLRGSIRDSLVWRCKLDCGKHGSADMLSTLEVT